MSGLAVGDVAPDFTLRDQFGQDVTLSAYRGSKAVALVFYPFAFSGVCTGEMGAMRDRLDELLTFDTEVLGISCDPVYALRQFADADGLNFPLLSDFWPHGGVAASLGILHERGFAVRGTFLVDADRVIRWALVNGPGERRDFDAYRRVMATVADPGGTA